MRSTKWGTATLAAVLVACSPPQAVSGGGVRGTFAGELTIIVVDDAGDPIASAEVWGGEGGTARDLGATDTSGILRTSERIDVLTATAPGRVAISIAARDASLVTIALPASDPAPSSLVHATVPGWGDLPLDGADYLVARASSTVALSLEPDDVVQPTDVVTQCMRNEPGGTCDLRFAVRRSPARIVVAIASGHDLGTPGDPSDDTLEPVALLLSEPITATSEIDVPLSRIDRADLVRVDVTTSGAPIELSAVVGVPGATTREGVVVWPFPGSGFLPALDEDDPSGSHWAIGDASAADARALTVVRGQRFADGDAVAIERWRDPPADLRIEGGVVSASGAQSGELWQLDVLDAAGRLAWRGHLFDARTSIAPPASLALPASGTLRVTATVHDTRGPDGELSIASIDTSFTERASRTLAFDGCPFAACP